MALFVDGPAATISDLTDQDSALLDVAAGNNVNLSAKLRLAMSEIRTDLELWLLKARPAFSLIWSPTLRIEQLVVTPTLQLWETMHALALVYRDVYFTQVIDRFEAKWQGYVTLASEARESYLAAGMAGVSDPLIQALPPVLGSVQASENGGEFYASVAWVNQSGQEGAASQASSLVVSNGNVMTVTPQAPPPNATGFRVYAGTSPGQMFLQNQTASPVTETFEYFPGQVTTGALPGRGQAAEFVRPVARTLLRG